MNEWLYKLARKANKEHKCSRCGALITKGATYYDPRYRWFPYKFCSVVCMCREMGYAFDVGDEN